MSVDNIYLESEWKEILDLIEQKRLIPFLVAGISSPFLPEGNQIAKEWAKDFDYPLENDLQLAKVAQFLTIDMHDEFYPKLRICEQFSRISIPDFSLPEYRNTAHSVLADLELPLYVTTNYDTLMEDALKSRGKKPVSEYCRWNERLENFEELAGLDSVVDKDRKFRPTEEEPLVYHLHGRIDIPHSLVLTEQDYFNFLGFLMRTGPERILPSFLRKGIVYGSFVFLGYSLQDINFLTLHSMFPGRMYPSFIVQLPPNIREERRERAISYLKEYQKLRFGGQLRTYFGTVGDFLLELRTRLGEFKE